MLCHCKLNQTLIRFHFIMFVINSFKMTCYEIYLRIESYLSFISISTCINPCELQHPAWHYMTPKYYIIILLSAFHIWNLICCSVHQEIFLTSSHVNLYVWRNGHFSTLSLFYTVESYNLIKFTIEDTPRPLFTKKMPSDGYRNPHYKPKIVWWRS